MFRISDIWYEKANSLFHKQELNCNHVSYTVPGAEKTAVNKALARKELTKDRRNPATNKSKPSGTRSSMSLCSSVPCTWKALSLDSLTAFAQISLWWL